MLCQAPWTLEGDWGERGLLLDPEEKPQKKGRGGGKKKVAGVGESDNQEMPKKKAKRAGKKADDSDEEYNG